VVAVSFLVLVAVGNVNTPMVFVSVLVMALLSLGLFAVISFGEWLVMRGRFNYLTIEVEN
jgi:ABC-type nitrate/sulfonate/bicarbonate transport system permease component